MDPARISALLSPFAPVPAGLADRLSTYLDLLLRWNARINLTAVRDPDHIVTRHFGESLFAARHLYGESPGDPITRSPDHPLPRSSPASVPSQPAGVSRLVDIGSGAGFPGIPIKLWAPSLHLALIESNYRKTIFLHELLRSLQLESVDVFHGRAEEFKPSGPSTVTLRAVERFQEILPIAASLARAAKPSPGDPITPSPDSSRLALLIGASQLASAYALLPDFTWHAPLPLPNSRTRILLVGAPQGS